jgi:hypothetical protein
MDNDYRMRRGFSNAVVTLRQLQTDCQRAGAYDWYNAVKACADELDWILRKLEVERARELSIDAELRLDLDAG